VQTSTGKWIVEDHFFDESLKAGGLSCYGQMRSKMWG